MTAVWIALGSPSRRVLLRRLRQPHHRRRTWPEEAPLQLRENRAHDQQINHLERLVAADDPGAAHLVVREVTGHLLACPSWPTPGSTRRRPRSSSTPRSAPPTATAVSSPGTPRIEEL